MEVPVGLVEYIRGECSLSEVMQVSREEAKLHVIPVRGRGEPGRGAGSPQLRKLIMRLRLCYDTIVLDVPPTLGVTDAQAVGMLADAAVFIAKWGATSDGAASNGVAALERAGVSIIGCALRRSTCSGTRFMATMMPASSTAPIAGISGSDAPRRPLPTMLPDCRCPVARIHAGLVGGKDDRFRASRDAVAEPGAARDDDRFPRCGRGSLSAG